MIKNRNFIVRLKKTAVLSVFTCMTIFSIHAQRTDGYSFFSDEDVQLIRQSSQTGWGRPVIDSLKNTVTERLKHPMEVPMLEGGHAHDYFCPVHNLKFSFDWNKPTSHYCSKCDKDWTMVNKINWAWVNEVHNRNYAFLNACAYLYLATEEEKYARYIKDMMLDYSVKYPTYMVHDRERRNRADHSGKMYAQSLDESVFASYAARAYSVAKPVMSGREIKSIEDGYLKPCAKLLLDRKSGGNWQVWHNSGLIALAVALQNDSIINIALNDSQRGYYALISQHVYDDGWWNEGSPTYHFYPLGAMLLSAEAVRCRGINLYDENLYKMFTAPAMGVYANLQFPSHNDGWYGVSLSKQANLYEIAYMRFKSDALLDVLKQSYSFVKRNSIESLQSNVDIKGEAFRPRKSSNFPKMGFGLLRSGNRTVVMKYGPGGGVHGHPDKLSVSIHNGTQEVLSDLGTTAYGVPDYKGWYARTLSHSTLTVDAKDQKLTEGKLLKFESFDNGGLLSAESNDAYEGVSMSRTLTLRGKQLTDVFTATSDEEHLYDYVLILTEPAVFTKKGTAVVLDDADVYKYIKNAVSISARKTISFKSGKNKIKIQSVGSDDFEVITGDSPGIPPTLSAGTASEPRCFPVIIRTKNKNMKIKAIWEIE